MVTFWASTRKIELILIPAYGHTGCDRACYEKSCSRQSVFFATWSKQNLLFSKGQDTRNFHHNKFTLSLRINMVGSFRIFELKILIAFWIRKRSSSCFSFLARNKSRKFHILKAKNWIYRLTHLCTIFLNGPFPASFSLFLSFQYSWQ